MRKLLCVVTIALAVNSTNALSSERTVNVTRLDSGTAGRLLARNIGEIAHKNISTEGLRVSNHQSFEVKSDGNTVYVVSVTHRQKSEELYPTHLCGLLLFDRKQAVLSALDLVGSDARPWTCDTTEAISFSDHYPDGSLRVIALYGATAPSSERFLVPVILKLDLRRLHLQIDEPLTSKLEDIDVSTIKEVRSALKKQ